MPDYSTISKCTLPTRQRDPSRESGTFVYVDIASINRESKRIEDPKETPCDQAPSRARKDIKAGDILVSTVRPNLNAVAQVPASLDSQIASTGFAVLRPNPSLIASRYLFYRVLDPAFVDDMTSQAKGAGYPAVSDRIVGAHKLPLPPLPEQDRIVEILDQADTLRQQRRQADALSQRILPALFREMFGRSEFPVVSIGDLASSEPNSIRTGPFGSQLLHSEFSDEGEVAVLGIDNVVTNDFRWDKPRFISLDRYQALRRYTVRPKDILVTIMGTCGRCAIAPADVPTAINTKHLCCITLDQTKCLPEFLHAAFLFDSQLRNHLGAREKGAVMPGLNMGVIKSAPVNLPPMPEQRKFANAAVAMDQPHQSATTSAATLETLFQTLLHRAFDGSLTAKWREGQAKEVLQEMEHQPHA